MNTAIAPAKKTNGELHLKIRTKKAINQMIQRSCLICGILSSLLYVAMNIFVATRFKGYSSVSQTVSELSSINAPTRSLWVSWGIVYTLLVTAFGWGVRQLAGQNRSMRIMGNLVFAYGVTSIFWPFAPMHPRGAALSLTDTMHITLAVITVLLMMLAIGFGAAAFGKQFRRYSFITIIILFVFGTLTGLDAPMIASNLPTPLVGIWERINIGVFLIWVMVVAIVLLGFQKSETSINNSKD